VSPDIFFKKMFLDARIFFFDVTNPPLPISLIPATTNLRAISLGLMVR
jgi:hypothetical protein